MAFYYDAYRRISRFVWPVAYFSNVTSRTHFAKFGWAIWENGTLKFNSQGSSLIKSNMYIIRTGAKIDCSE